MKRAIGTKKTEGDFKRLKAKVGKRAPKKLSETETKFKTATVQVQTQSIVNEAVERDASPGGLALSSTGKQFSQLVAQLNHHAAKGRISAAQGIRDIIKNTTASVIPNYLSIIVPSVSKCLIDEDSDVRSAAISTLFEEVHPRLASCNLTDSMKPFLPISLAYIGSALHSLDQDVRYDGCKALHQLCTAYSNLFLAGENEITHLQSLLPAFVMLFDDVFGGLASMSRRGVGSLSDSGVDKNSSKDKQARKKRGSRALGVLESFVSVTNHITSFRRGHDVLVGNSVNVTSCHEILSRADLAFCSGGRASNALVWKSDQVHFARKISDMKHLEYSCRESSVDGTISFKLDFNTILSLFLRLRDRFVEVSQRGKQGDKGLYLSSGDASELSLVVSSLRVLWIGFCEEIITIRRLENDSNCKKMKANAVTVLNLLLESFTVRDSSGNESNREKYDSLNTSMCMLLSEIGGAVDNVSDSSDASEWIEAIFMYVAPALEIIDNMDTENSRFTLMMVIERLLLPSEMSNIIGIAGLKQSGHLNDQKYMELLEKFKRAYFDQIESRDKICGSIEGRKAVSLLLSLIDKHISCHTQFELNEIFMTLIEMSSNLPIYLRCWRGSFPKDTAMVLATLSLLSKSLLRHHHNNNNESIKIATSFVKTLASSLENLFTTSKKQMKIRVSEHEIKAKVSIFEELSNAGQTLLLNLVGFLEAPSSKLTEDLAQICARRITMKSSDGKSSDIQLLSDSIIDYLMGVLHFMRRQFSLKQYLTFVVNSSGLHSIQFGAKTDNQGEANVSSYSYDEYKNIFTYDSAIARTCRYLVKVESKQVMPMLKPILDSWLTITDDDCLLLQTLKTRAAITLLSCHALSVRSSNIYADGKMIDDVDFRRRLIHAVMNFLRNLPSENTDDLNFAKIRSKLISPFMVIFKCYPSLLLDTIENVDQFISSNDHSTELKEKMLHTLIYLIKSKSLATAFRDVDHNLSTKLLDMAFRLDKQSSGGTLHSASGKLVMEVQALLGFNAGAQSKK
mmetsp:Transcript_12283/g.23009  ORF Transcript_12283/g.23009 Transcript_12283/m.23009 type:complete len:1020 (+) Transcript_12283:131-3190(+)